MCTLPWTALQSPLGSGSAVCSGLSSSHPCRDGSRACGCRFAAEAYCHLIHRLSLFRVKSHLQEECWVVSTRLPPSTPIILSTPIHRYATARHVALQRPCYRAKFIVTVQKHLATRGVHLLHARVAAESNQSPVPLLSPHLLRLEHDAGPRGGGGGRVVEGAIGGDHACVQHCLSTGIALAALDPQLCFHYFQLSKVESSCWVGL